MRRSGVTLVELIVVLAILSVVASVTGLAIQRAVPVPGARAWVRGVADARRMAVDSARAMTIVVTIDSVPHAVTALPDGSVIADAAVGVDRLSGAPIHAR